MRTMPIVWWTFPLTWEWCRFWEIWRLSVTWEWCRFWEIWRLSVLFVIWIYLRALVSNTISTSDDVRRASYVEQELLTLPEHLSSHPGYSRVHGARSLVFCVVFYRSLFVLFGISSLIPVLIAVNAIRIYFSL